MIEITDKYLLTIVTVNRNNADNLPRTLKSLEQMHGDPDVECIFIDGASTDNSVVIARKFYKPQNLVSEPDTGIYNAMNKGLFKARGKFVLWLNSGDELIENSKPIIKRVLAGSNAAIISFKTLIKSPDTGNIIAEAVPTEKKLPEESLPHSSSFFKRSVCLRIGGYNERFRIVADRDLIIRIYLMGCDIETRDEEVAIFYAGGVCYSKRIYLETIWLNKYYGLLKPYQYYLRLPKYWLMFAPIIGRMIRWL